MFEKIKASRKNSKDEKLLASHQARDAKVGVPTKETLTERALAAAREGNWKTALSSFRQGGDVNAWTEFKKENLDPNIYHLKVRHPASFLAIEQDRPDVLRDLLALGANPRAEGEFNHFMSWQTDPILSFTVRHGTADTMDVLLGAGAKDAPEALNQALAVAAARPGQAAMVGKLLAHGAAGYETALRAAEKVDNAEAIVLIRAAEKAVGGAPPGPAGVELDRREKALYTALEGLAGEDRRQLFERLRNRFTADFDAAAGKAEERPSPPVNISLKVLGPQKDI